ncbi:MAG TPA: hypothetical protein VEU29_05605 [Actinomycetota bacterium]|nr:hypothetical protein [Actinomycetota bacterium]
MRKTVALSVAAMLLGGMVATAAPAQAQTWPTSCAGYAQPPDLYTVYVDDQGVIHVRTDSVVGDAITVALWPYYTGWYVTFCLEDGVVSDPAFCMAGILSTVDLTTLNLRYVYPEPGGYAINVPLLISDVNACS